MPADRKREAQVPRCGVKDVARELIPEEELRGDLEALRVAALTASTHRTMVCHA